jgi:hypothetical protein
MQVLALGFGIADLSTVVRPENPQRRDVQVMPPAQGDTPSDLIIQWDADNPGVWKYHCFSRLQAMLTSREEPPLPLQLALLSWSRSEHPRDTDSNPQNLGPGCSHASGADVQGLECFHQDRESLSERY